MQRTLNFYALIILARAGIQIINILPCGRALKGARYIYKIGNAVRTFNPNLGLFFSVNFL